MRSYGSSHEELNSGLRFTRPTLGHSAIWAWQKFGYLMGNLTLWILSERQMCYPWLNSHLCINAEGDRILSTCVKGRCASKYTTASKCLMKRTYSVVILLYAISISVLNHWSKSTSCTLIYVFERLARQFTIWLWTSFLVLVTHNLIRLPRAMCWKKAKSLITR